MSERTIETIPYARMSGQEALDYGKLLGERELVQCPTCGQWGNHLMGGTEDERLFALDHNCGDYHFCLLCCTSHYAPDGTPEWAI